MPWGAVAAAVAGAAATSLLSDSGGGGGTTTVQQQQTADPWSGVQPYLKDLFAKAQAGQQAGPYPGPYIAPQSPYTQQAIAQQAANARNSNGLVGQAQGQLGATIGGQYLSPSSNPYLQQTLDQLTGNALRATNSQFSGDNFGSSANQQWLTKNITDATAPYLSSLYTGERTNQLNALNLAPGLQSANTSQLAGAGASQDAYNQAVIQAAQAKYGAPMSLLSQYQGLISGQPGGSVSGSTQTPYYTNTAANALGGALGGLQLYNAYNSYANTPSTPTQFQSNAYANGFGNAFYNMNSPAYG